MPYRETQINEQFPEAGRDNESQGFRDNFSAIKDSLTQAKTDIEGLEESRLDISSPSTDLNGNTVDNINLKSPSYEFNAGGNVISSQNVSYASGIYHVFTCAKSSPSPGSPIVFTISDFPPAGKLAVIRIHLYGNGSTQYFDFATESAGDFYADASWPVTLSVASASVPKIFEFWTYDGGQNVYSKYLGEFTAL